MSFRLVSISCNVGEAEQEKLATSVSLSLTAVKTTISNVRSSVF